MTTWHDSSHHMLGQKCHYCPDEATTRDHIVPAALGGKNGNYNLVPSCRRCNENKADEMPTCRCKKCRDAVRTWDRNTSVERVRALLEKEVTA